MIKVIEESKGNEYCTKFKVGDKVRFIHPGNKLSKEVATITGYDSDGFYTYTWDDGEKGNGSSDRNFKLVSSKRESKLKRSLTDELINNPNARVVLWDEEDSNRVINVDKVDKNDDGSIYKVHVVFNDTVNGDIDFEWMYPDELNDIIKDNAGTCKLLRN